MTSWEKVKSLPYDKYVVYHINGKIIGPLEGKVCEISPAGQKTWPEYHFVLISNNNLLIAAFTKDELLFVEKA